MSGTAEGLEQHCRQVVDSAASAVQWLRAISTRLGKPTEQAENELRAIGVRAAKLGQISARPLNVGVFGSNMSGKSFLAAALARRGATPLRIVLGNERVDYFARINPLRTPKSSSCITRFSLHQPEFAVDGLPVYLRLLSQSDVVRIIANSYLEDVDPQAAAHATPERLSAIHDRLRAQKHEPQDGMSAEDVTGTQAYLQRYFSAHKVISSLGPDYWQAAIELAPRLPVQGRAVLFSVLWGETPQLTVLCVRLLQALDALGNAEQAFCPMDALDIQTNSITDANTMMQGLEDETAAKVVVGIADGRRVEMTRPMVTALAAELHLALEEQAFGFLNNADLLDFPGAPARSRFTEPDSLFADPTNRARHFRRGKAAYLFQLYVANQEISALLLCMEDTPPTARTLPNMVLDWIDTMQGGSPEDRRDMPCALFVALTKFDQDLKEELRQKEDDPEHWANRLQTVFDDFLCRENRWADRWLPGRPFNNVFWLRNPVIPEPEVLQYNAAGRETGLVDRGRIARLRGRFVSTPRVRDRFADPGRAWDEVLKLNDGGVSYIAGQLRTICDPEQRRKHMAELLSTLARDMHQCLEPFYVATTPAKPAEETPAADATPAAESAPMSTENTAASQTADTSDMREMVAPGSLAATALQETQSAAARASVAVAAEARDAGGGSNVKMLAIAAAVVLALIGGAFMLFSGGSDPKPTPPPVAGPATPAARTQAPAPASGQVPTAQRPAAPSVVVPLPPVPTPAAPAAQVTRCGPIVSPERLGALPADAQITPTDMVCVARAWIAAGRATDAVFQLTRALQASPNRVFGPASLELAKLYDPLRANPNWSPNAAFALENYQDATSDANFPDIQREAQTSMEALRNAPGR